MFESGKISKRWISILLSGAFLLQTACGASPASVRTNDTVKGKAPDVTVYKDAEKFTAKLTEEEPEGRIVVTDFAAPSDDKWEGASYGGMTVLSCNSETEAQSLADSLVSNGYAETAWTDEAVFEVQSDIPYLSTTKAVPEKNDYFKTKEKEGPVVVLVDTGVDGFSNIDLTGEGDEDDNGHGTMTAGIIASECEDTRIVSIKALGKDGNGYLTSVAAALEKAKEYDPDVVCLPFAMKDSSKTEIMEEKITELVSGGTKVIAAAGNAASDAGGYFPARMDEVVTVGACASDGTPMILSNTGDAVDCYVEAATTSAASARMAGILASGKKTADCVHKKDEAKDGKTEIPATTDDAKDTENTEDTHDTHETDSQSKSTSRLLVIAEDADELDQGTVVGSEDGISLLSFENAESAKAAITYYKKKGIQAVYDRVLLNWDGQETDDTAGADYDPFKQIKDAEDSASEEMIAILDDGSEKGSNVKASFSTTKEAGNGESSAVKALLSEYPDAKIVSIRITDKNGNVTLSSVYAGLETARKSGAGSVLLPFSAASADDTEFLTDLMGDMYEEGITFYIAAGDEGVEVHHAFPADFLDGAIFGACTEEKEKLPQSNFGLTVGDYVQADNTKEAAALGAGIAMANIAGVKPAGPEAYEHDLVIRDSSQEEAYAEQFLTQKYGYAEDYATAASGTGWTTSQKMGGNGSQWSGDKLGRLIFSLHTIQGDPVFCVDPMRKSDDNTRAYGQDISGGIPTATYGLNYNGGHYQRTVTLDSGTLKKWALVWKTLKEKVGGRQAQGAMALFIYQELLDGPTTNTSKQWWVLTDQAKNRSIDATQYINEGIREYLNNGDSYEYTLIGYHPDGASMNTWPNSQRFLYLHAENNKYTVHISKSTPDTGYTRFHTLAGAVYGVFSNAGDARNARTFEDNYWGAMNTGLGGLLGRMVTDWRGNAWLAGLRPQNIYYVKELYAPTGYAIDGNVYQIRGGQTKYQGVDYRYVYDFDYYYNHYEDLRGQLGGNPYAFLSHFVNHGANEERQAIDSFNVAYYGRVNGDVSGMWPGNPLAWCQHYISCYYTEGRLGYAVKSGTGSGMTSGYRSTDYPKAHLHLTKQDEATGELLPGCVFKIQKLSNGNWVDYGKNMTDQGNGHYESGTLYGGPDNPYGQFRVVEMKTYKDHYILPYDPSTQEVRTSTNGTNLYPVSKNRHEPVKISVRKKDPVDPEKTSLYKAEFKIYPYQTSTGKYNGTPIDMVFNEETENYEATVQSLPENAGKFLIRETRSPRNYTAVYEHAFQIDKEVGDSLYFEADNTHQHAYADLIIKKTDIAHPDETLNDTTYKVYEWRGTSETEGSYDYSHEVTTLEKSVLEKDIEKDGKVVAKKGETVLRSPERSIERLDRDTDPYKNWGKFIVVETKSQDGYATPGDGDLSDDGTENGNADDGYIVDENDLRQVTLDGLMGASDENMNTRHNTSGTVNEVQAKTESYTWNKEFVVKYIPDEQGEQKDISQDEGIQRDGTDGKQEINATDAQLFVYDKDDGAENYRNKLFIYKINRHKEPLAGVKFNVCRINESDADCTEEYGSFQDDFHTGTYTTDAKGTIEIDRIPPGEYKFHEVEVLPNYHLESAWQTFTVDQLGYINKRNVYTYMDINEHEQTINLDKYDEELRDLALKSMSEEEAEKAAWTDTTNAAVNSGFPNGTVFHIYEWSEANRAFKEGEIYRSVVYARDEEYDPANPEHDREYDFVDESTLHAYEPAGYNDHNEPNVLQGKKVRLIWTPENRGKFRIREVHQTDGYVLHDRKPAADTPQSDTDDNRQCLDIEITEVPDNVIYDGEVKTKTFSNHPNHAWLKKTDTEGEPLKGITFEIWRDGHASEPIGTGPDHRKYVTDENGLIDLQRLAPGTWWYQELSVPDEYLNRYTPDQDPHSFIVKADGTVDGIDYYELAETEKVNFDGYYRVVNEKQQQLKFHKIDSESGEEYDVSGQTAFPKGTSFLIEQWNSTTGKWEYYETVVQKDDWDKLPKDADGNPIVQQ